MNTIKKTLDIIFIVTMIAYVILSFIMIFGQLFAVVTVNGALAAAFESMLVKKAATICCTTGIVCFIMSYIYKWKASE